MYNKIGLLKWYTIYIQVVYTHTTKMIDNCRGLPRDAQTPKTLLDTAQCLNHRLGCALHRFSIDIIQDRIREYIIIIIAMLPFQCEWPVFSCCSRRIAVSGWQERGSQGAQTAAGSGEKWTVRGPHWTAESPPTLAGSWRYTNKQS